MNHSCGCDERGPAPACAAAGEWHAEPLPRFELTMGRKVEVHVPLMVTSDPWVKVRVVGCKGVPYQQARNGQRFTVTFEVEG